MFQTIATQKAGDIESIALDLKRKNLRRVCKLLATALCLFASFNIYNGDHFLAAVEMVISCLVLFAMWVDSRQLVSLNRITDMLILLTTVFFTCLFISGGAEGSGIYWVFVFPFVAHFFKGVQQGLIWTVLFFGINTLVIALNMPESVPYNSETLLRAVLVYVSVGAFAYYYESLHFRRQFEMKFDQKKFELLIENSHDVIAIVDPLGTMLFLSPSIEQMTGFSAAELVDKNAFEFIHHDDAVKVKKALARLAFNKKGVERDEYRFKKKTGDWVYVEGIGRPVVDEEGILTIVLNVRDVSERKQMEEVMQEQEFHLGRQFAELNNIYNTAPIGMGFVDTDLRFVRINQALSDMNGVPVEEHIGRTLREVLPDLAVQVEPIYMDVIQSGKPVTNHEIHGQTAAQPGIERAWLVDYYPVSFESGEVIGVSVFVQEITEQKQMEDKFHQAQKMEAIGTLIGGIAHDFNNTLAAVQGNLYLAKAYAPDAPLLNERLENVESLATHAANIVEQLMTFARKGMVSIETMSLTRFAKETMKLSVSVVPDNIEHVCNFCDEELMIQGDGAQLQQVMINLLSNASDAVAGVEQPKISCRLEPYSPDAAFAHKHPLEPDRQYAHLVVSDNGCGIPEQLHEHIFEPFFTTKEVGKGSGLGLAMVYGAVQTHHGLVDVKSEPGCGTEFHIYLPLIQARQDESDQSEPGFELISQPSREVILIADDNEKILWATDQVLQKKGYKTLTAENGQQALELFRLHQTDVRLVISDVVMPKMGGVESVQEMRKINQDLPVIFVTGYDREKAVIPDMMQNNSAFLRKPFSFVQLNQLVVDMILAPGQENK